MEQSNLEQVKQSLIDDINQRMTDKIIEPTNAELLIKLITNADNTTEALAIAELGTTYRKTGFHFDKRLEATMGSDIKYLRKNTDFSFSDGSEYKNSLIVGDNYDALLNLLITHKGAIDMIYIDPPYGSDSMGNFAETNYTNAITRDNLLSMLYPRLILAKQLLSDTGTIFCSIDDKNHAYVKCLFDDVFAESNFLGNIVWGKKRKGSFLSKNVVSLTEHILAYSKSSDNFKGLFGGVADESESQPIIKRTNAVKVLKINANLVATKLKDGVYKAGVYGNDVNPVKLINDVMVKNGLIVNDFEIEGPFIWSQEMLNQELSKGTRLVINTLNFQIRAFRVADDDKFKGLASYINGIEIKGTNEDAYEELQSLFNSKVFDYSKPVNLMKKLLNAATHFNKSAVVLDFFAGSGTTGQAVLELNKEDGGNRQFILCTNNEMTDVNPNGIAYDVTAKRLKRVMTGQCYDDTNDFEWIKKNDALGGSLDVYDIETVNNAEQGDGKSPFDVIDETCYGREKFTNPAEKIAWVCSNFEKTQQYLKEE